MSWHDYLIYLAAYPSIHPANHSNSSFHFLLPDTSNFDVDETDFTPKEAVPLQSNSIFSGNHLPFVGFTYTKGSKLSDLESLLEAGMLLLGDGSGVSIHAL